MTPEVFDIVYRALEEDIGCGDVTSAACIDAKRKAEGRFVARQRLVLAGADLLAILFDDPVLLHKDGDLLQPGDAIAEVVGPARTLLSRERVSLNFLQHLSGIATLARRFVDAVAGTKCRILDTRKTTPGLRVLEKMAVAAGGAVNHRMGLYDAILIKNNHIAIAGGVREAVRRARPAGLPMEVEVRTRTEIDEALAEGATHLLLDNMSPDEAAGQIRHIAGRATVELSGGITLETARAYAEAGADYLSAGAITHSAPAVDIHLRIQ